MAMRYRASANSETLMASLYRRKKKLDVESENALAESAETIKEESVLNSPLDLGNLEESHKVYQDKTAAGFSRFTVAVGGVVNGVDVDDYLLLMHENYDSIATKGGGERTKQKRQQNPGRLIGGKFLERAYAQEAPRIKKRLREILKGSFSNV